MRKLIVVTLISSSLISSAVVAKELSQTDKKLSDLEMTVSVDSFNKALDVAGKGLIKAKDGTVQEKIKASKDFEAAWRQAYYEQKYHMTFDQPLDMAKLDAVRANCEIQITLKVGVGHVTISEFEKNYDDIEKCIAKGIGSQGPDISYIVERNRMINSIPLEERKAFAKALKEYNAKHPKQ